MASALSALFLILSSTCIARGGVHHGYPSIIKLGSSLSPASNHTSWPSPTGRFAFGFYSQSHGISVGIWLDGNGTTENKVVWTVNRDDPPVSSNATLMLNEKGLFLLTTKGGGEKVVANISTDSTVFSASMLDSGNFVLKNKSGHIIWESFKNPTDTILGDQILARGSELISSLSEDDHSTGRFHLRMQEDGNLVLYPFRTGGGDTADNAYWAWSSYNYDVHNNYHLYLNSTVGQLQLINNSDLAIIRTIDEDDVPEKSHWVEENDSNHSYNSTAVYSASVDFDGNFRLYAHLFHPSGGFETSTRFEALKNYCKIKGFCGFNSFCTFNDLQPYCVCLPGIDFIDPHKNTLGCKRNYSEAGCIEEMANKGFYNISPIENIDWGTGATGTYYSDEKMSNDECSRTCLEDCDCEAALFKDGICKKQKLPLMYLVRDSEQVSTVFLKVGLIGLVPENGSILHGQKPTGIMPFKRKEPMVKILLLTFSLVVCSCVLLAIAGLFVYKFRVLRDKRLLENGKLGLTEDLTLMIFSYHELKRATNGFKEELVREHLELSTKGLHTKVESQLL